MVPLEPIRKPHAWVPAAEMAALLLALAGLGVMHFSRLSPAEQARVDLEAGMEQVYRLELDFHTENGRYIDPTDPAEGLEWAWVDRYRWEFSATADSFTAEVRADLDEDGDVGVWVIDQRTPRPRRLVAD